MKAPYDHCVMLVIFITSSSQREFCVSCPIDSVISVLLLRNSDPLQDSTSEYDVAAATARSRNSYYPSGVVDLLLLLYQSVLLAPITLERECSNACCHRSGCSQFFFAPSIRLFFIAAQSTGIARIGVITSRLHLTRCHHPYYLYI
jgi:hypothetical protein